MCSGRSSAHSKCYPYDAGLKLEAVADVKKPAKGSAFSYRAPLRCGMIMADVTELGGRFTIWKIKAWTDIINPAGKILSTSWPTGANEPVMMWI